MKRKGWLFGLGIVAAFLMAPILEGFGVKYYAPISALCVIGLYVGWLIYLWIHKKEYDEEAAARKAKYEAKYGTPEERREAAAVEKQKRREQEEFYRRMRADEQRPVWSKVVTSSANTVNRGSVVGTGARMLVGNALLGPGGAILGAATGARHTYTKDQEVTFAVKYTSGRRGTETVKVGSARFNELCAVLEE